MLMILGSVVFEIAPINVERLNHSASASFAHHPVLGEMPPLEFTGTGPENWRLEGKLYPQFNQRQGLSSGLESIDEIHAMRESGQAQFLMRGDGVPMGFVVILHASERSNRLAADGIGRVIEFEVDLTRSKMTGGDLSSYSGSSEAALPGGTNLDLMPSDI